MNQYNVGADPAFLIRRGPNSEIFLSDLRKLFKRDKFFVLQKISQLIEVLPSTAQFLIIPRSVYINSL